MLAIRYLDLPPVGWFALDVMKPENPRKWDWVALMVDVDPDDLKYCLCKIAFIYVDPDEYRARWKSNSARSLGPCPWQASQQGSCLGGVARYARDAALTLHDVGHGIFDGAEKRV